MPLLLRANRKPHTHVGAGLPACEVGMHISRAPAETPDIRLTMRAFQLFRIG
jgi:hypothetical protein